VAYFDQLREQLDPEQTVDENVGEGKDIIKMKRKTTSPIRQKRRSNNNQDLTNYPPNK
jgi:hypothetical protein